MATPDVINPLAKYCRYCGSRTTQRDGFTWCDYRRGSVVCDHLTLHTRKFCEHCGQASPGPGKCPKCGNPPTTP